MTDDRLPPRFWAKVNVTPTCWQWTAAKHPEGYGHYKVGGVVRPAHRVSYEALVGPIGAGLQLDHLCRNTSCVNPAHLEPVSQRVNVLRGEGPTAQNSRLTACRAGHPFSVENTYLIRSGGRGCRHCNREAVARYKARKRAA